MSYTNSRSATQITKCTQPSSGWVPNKLAFKIYRIRTSYAIYTNNRTQPLSWFFCAATAQILKWLKEARTKKKTFSVLIA